jgi:cardiolipin synthase
MRTSHGSPVSRAAGFDARSPMRLLPNQLTAARLALIPVLWTLALAGRPALIGPLLVLAAATDVVDGIVARRTHTATRFGSALDSVADHLLAATTVGMIALLRPDFVGEQWVPLALWALFGTCVLAVGWVRHRRLGNVHLYTAKVAGVVCYAFVAALFFFDGYSRVFFAAAVGLAFLAAAETLLVLLTRIRVDEHAGSIFLAPQR